MPSPVDSEEHDADMDAACACCLLMLVADASAGGADEDPPSLLALVVPPSLLALVLLDDLNQIILCHDTLAASAHPVGARYFLVTVALQVRERCRVPSEEIHLVSGLGLGFRV